MIDALTELGDNHDFRWGMIIGVIVAATVVLSFWLHTRKQTTAAVTVGLGGLVVVVFGLSRRGGPSHLLANASFRWGVLGGCLVVGAVALCAWSIAERRFRLAAVVAAIAVAALFVVGFRNGVDDLRHNDGFHKGLLGGVVVAACAALVALLARRRQFGVAALGVCGAAFLSLELADRVPPRFGELIGACVLLGVGGLAAAAVKRGAWFRVLVAIPGALLLGDALQVILPSSRAYAAVAVTVAAFAGWSPERSRRLCAEPALLVVTLAGVYVCVPETVIASVVLGAAVPFVVLGWPTRILSNGAAVPAVFGLVVWIAFVGGSVRDGSIVGAVACLGVFVLLALVSLGRGRAGTPDEPSAALVAVVHVLLVLWCSRVAGLENDAVNAAVIAALGAAAAVLALRAWPALVRSIRA